MVVDETLHVQSVNRAFCEQFGILPVEVERQPLGDGDGEWSVPGLRELLEQVLRGAPGEEHLVAEHEFPTIGRRKLRLTARRVNTATGKAPLVLIGIDDHTGRD